MKNIALSLTMTFLFGMFYPGANAYANSKKYIEFNKIENNFIFNGNLVNKLAKSKDFEAFYNQMYSLMYYSAMSLSIKSEKEIEELAEQAKEFEISKNQDTDKAFHLLGFNFDSATIKKFEAQTDKLRNNLVRSFPELSLISKDEMQKVIENAIIKGDFESKALASRTKDECYDNAYTNFSNCQLEGRWWRRAGTIAGGICVAAVIVCVLVVTYTSGPAGVAAISEQAFGIAKACMKATAAWFGVTSTAILVDCSTSHALEINACVAQWGSTLGGGGE